METTTILKKITHYSISIVTINQSTLIASLVKNRDCDTFTQSLTLKSLEFSLDYIKTLEKAGYVITF